MKKIQKFAVAAAAGLFLALLAQPVSAQMKDPSETLKVNFIIHQGCGNVFYEPIIYGANLAGEIFNVDVTMQCPEGDIEAHIDLIETGVAGGVDGIIDQISVPDTMTDAIQKARDAGVSFMSASVRPSSVWTSSLRATSSPSALSTNTASARVTSVSLRWSGPS